MLCVKAFTLPYAYIRCHLPNFMGLMATSGVHHRLESTVTLRGVAWLSSTVMRVLSIYSVICSTFGLVHSFFSGRLLDLVRRYTAALSF